MSSLWMMSINDKLVDRLIRDSQVCVSESDWCLSQHVLSISREGQIFFFFLFVLNKFRKGCLLKSQNRRAPNIHMSSWPARMLRDFSRAFRGLFGLCAKTHIIELLTWQRGSYLSTWSKIQVKKNKLTWKYIVVTWMCDLNSLWFFLRNTPTHMRPPASSRNPGLQMHLKLPSSLMQSPLRHMFLIRHSSMSVNEHKEIDRLTAVHLDIKSQSFVYFTSSLSRDKPTCQFTSGWHGACSGKQKSSLVHSRTLTSWRIQSWLPNHYTGKLHVLSENQVQKINTKPT